MTKAEAIVKCLDTLKGDKIEGKDINVYQLVKMLEALGLLKFEKKRLAIMNIIDKDQLVLLMDNGYRIVRIDDENLQFRTKEGVCYTVRDKFVGLM